MENDLKLHCLNCGHVWRPDESPAGTTATCPVCQFRVADPVADIPPVSADELETRLSTLVEAAFAGGVAPDAIVQVLQDELEFAAELAHSGRRMYVQIIDLGPQERAEITRPAPDRSTVLRSRAVEG